MKVRKCRGCGMTPVLTEMLKSEGYDADLFQYEHDGSHADCDRVDLTNDACMPVESKTQATRDWNAVA